MIATIAVDCCGPALVVLMLHVALVLCLVCLLINTVLVQLVKLLAALLHIVPHAPTALYQQSTMHATFDVR